MSRPGRILAPALCLLVASQPAQAGFTVPPNRPGAFAPRDECAGLPGATAFRAALREAIARRDAAALVALAADDVQLDFGGGAGKAELRARLTGKGGAELWGELAALMPLGCAVSDGEMVLPWFFAQDLGDVDTFDALLATGRDVPIYSAANARGRRAAKLDWQLVVPLVDPPAPRGFRMVSVINSRLRGLVAEDRLRSPIAYRLVAGRNGAKWKIHAFVAGD